MNKATLLAAAAIAFFTTLDAEAQSVERDCGRGTSLESECREEFERWQKAEIEWREWVKRHGNTYARSSNGMVVTSRPARPEPLSWMFVYCGRTPEPSPECVAHQEALDYNWLENQAPPPTYVNKKTVSAGESSDIWTWLWKSTHIDFGWAPPDPRQRTVGIVGVHLSLAQIGDRLYVFGPGALLTLHQGRLKVGTTWGVSYRLTDFKFLRVGPSFDLFLNAANLKLEGGQIDVMSERKGGRGVIGLSFAIRK